MEDFLLEIHDIVKKFPGVLALDHVSFNIKRGTVHALVGENGAGKSTLMNCLFGILRPDQGHFILDGKKYEAGNPHVALTSGIAMIHQELSPLMEMTVQDNIWLGRFKRKGIVVDETAMLNDTKDLLQRIEFDINPRTYAKNLSVSQLQAVEIAKSLSYNAKIIIMDEPTSSLTTSETEHLFKLIKKVKDSGASVIYISHKLEEIITIADDVTVMRDGAAVGTWPINELNIDDVINKMVGRQIKQRFPQQEVLPKEETALSVKNLTSFADNGFEDISFTLKKGEILGIGGLVGSRRTELVETLFGLRRIKGGQIVKDNKDIKIRSPIDAISHGFGLLTEERRATGIIPMLSVKDNILISNLKQFTSKFGTVKTKQAVDKVTEACTLLQVKAPSIDSRIMTLSGGNQQKVLFCRWLLNKSNILILDEPTRGVDVGAKYEIYKTMRELTAQGYSIIMVSSEMPELLGMSDRILVMCAGQATGILSKDEFSQKEVMRLAMQHM